MKKVKESIDAVNNFSFSKNYKIIYKNKTFTFKENSFFYL